jgi:GTP cyclohydrolase IA
VRKPASVNTHDTREIAAGGVREAFAAALKENMSTISIVAPSNRDRQATAPRPGSSQPSERRAVDRTAVARATRDLLIALGADLDSEGPRETPRRMAAAYLELLTPAPFSLTTFPNDEGYDELVVVRDIPFQSLCMHHVLPFYGVAHVAYLPAERILGLSKLARAADLFARDLQLQERLTTQIAGWLQRGYSPRAWAWAWCWRPSTCACRCEGCRSRAPRPLPRRCTASSVTSS